MSKFEIFRSTLAVMMGYVPLGLASLVHAQYACPDGTFRIEGPGFQDLDIAMAAKHTIAKPEASRF